MAEFNGLNKRILWISLSLLYFTGAGSQVLMNKDSLLRLLPHAKEDSNKVLLYINLGQQYEGSEPEIAKSYYLRAKELSKKIGYPTGVLKFISNYGYIMNMQGHYDSSLLLNKEAVALAREMKDSLNLAKALFNLGTSYRGLGDYENAILNYEEGKKLFVRFGNAGIEAQGNDILQLLYFDLGQYDKAIAYGEASVAYMRQTENLPLLGVAVSNLAMSYSNKGDLKKARTLYEEALRISRQIGDISMESTQLLNLGDIHLQLGEYGKLEPYFNKAKELVIRLGAQESTAIALRGLGIYHFFKRDFKQAIQYGEEALAITRKYNLPVQEKKNLETLSSIYYGANELEKGEEYLRLSTHIGDSLLNETVQKNTLELEKKYDSEKKEIQIRELTAERKVQELSIRQKNILNNILIAGTIMTLLIFFLTYRAYRQKQKLQQQRINELETEKQLAATEAVLKGEEQERTRLAKDLHDGLGGMLSGIKYSFATMKGNLIMTPENQQAFERSMDMLDSSIKEMRRVAHNMMPEVLVKFGLDTALKDFCTDITLSGALHVDYQSIGLEETAISQTTAITVYRIVQELIHNTIKHAAASNAIVQLGQNNGQLSITVEENGKGFDTAATTHKGGMGWLNIRNRVNFLKGKLDIHSETGKGSSVWIEVPL